MKPTVAVLDHGMGNLHSVRRALAEAGASPLLTADPAEVEQADALVLPGVGAFGPAIDAMRVAGQDTAVVAFAASGRPVLGVCLGFQLLFDRSEESGGRQGLGLLSGAVRRIDAGRGRVPHLGWNRLRRSRDEPLLDGIDDGAWVYFVHSYAAEDCAEVVAVADYGGPITAMCRRDAVMGTQFHPEKSGRDGLRLYANFVALCGNAPGAGG